MTLLAYAWVVKGMVLAASPYRFRRAMAFCLRSRAACRGFGAAGLAVGALLMALAARVY